MQIASHSRRRIALVGALACACCSTVSSAAYVKSYNADSAATAPDPATPEGGSWNLAGNAPQTVAKGPGSEDGHNYWEVNDTNTSTTTGNAANNSVIYNVTTAVDPDLTAAFSAGWQFTARLAVPVSSNQPALAPPSYNVPTWVDIRDGRRIYTIAFVNDGTNEGIYRAQGGSSFTASESTLIAALDLDVYHTVSMTMVSDGVDHSQDAVKISIDGTEVYTLDTSNTNTTAVAPRVQWGSGVSTAVQTVHWQSVVFQSPAPPLKITGDTNGDGVVDLADLNNVLNNFGSNVSGNPGDDNGDNLVDLQDLNNVLNNFGAHAAAAALAVPEPASLALCGLAALPMLRRRRQK